MIKALIRAALVGAASGSRASVGIGAVALTAQKQAVTQPDRTLGNPWVKGVLGAMMAGELVGDKLPQTPSRINPQGLVPRGLTSVASGVAVAQREPDGTSTLPAAAGVALAAMVATALLGVRWRAWCADAFGDDYLGAGVEDVWSLVTGFVGARGF